MSCNGERTHGIDTWSACYLDARWRVVDRNGCEVADCGDRKADAELIVHYSRTYEKLLRALRAALPYLMCFSFIIFAEPFM